MILPMNRTCYLCGNEKNVILFIEKGIPIVRCSNCGHVFSTFKQDEHYQWYWGEEIGYDLTWWDVAHREIYKNFIDKFLLSAQGRILDVGCGLGFLLKQSMTIDRDGKLSATTSLRKRLIMPKIETI